MVAVAGPGGRQAAHASTGNKGGDYVALTPEGHLLDTRSAIGVTTKTPVAAGKTVVFQALGVGGVPATGVTAVLVDITATGGSAATYLSLGPDDSSFSLPPTTSNLNVPASTTQSNSAVTKVAADGKIAVYNYAGTTHVVVDVQGYYTATSSGSGPGGLVPVAQTTVLDTRDGTGEAGGKAATIAAGGTLTVNMSAGGLVPAGATSAYFESVVIGSASGWIGVYPAGGAANYTSLFDYLAGTSSSGGTSKLGTNNSVVFVNRGSAAINLVLDVQGYTTSDTSTGYGYVASRFRAGLVSVPALSSADVQVAGQGFVNGAGGVPTHGAQAIAASFGVVAGSANGWIRAYADDQPAPPSSIDNYPAGATRADFAIVQLGADGKVRIYNGSGQAIRVYIDVLGWYTDGKSNMVDTVPNTPLSVVQPTVGGPLEGVYLRNSGTPFHGLVPADKPDNAQWQAISANQEAFTGQPSVVSLSTSKQLLVSLLHANNGEVWTFTVPISAGPDVAQWSPVFNHTGGVMASAPVATTFVDGQTPAIFAVDADGQLWELGSATGAWHPVGSNVGLAGAPSLALNQSSNTINIVGRTTGGNVVTASFASNGTMSAWTNLGGTGVTSTPAALELTGPRLRIAALQSDGTVLTILQNLDGSFPSAWKTIANMGHSFVGAPALVLDLDKAGSANAGTGEAVLLLRESTDNRIYESDETAEASDVFGDWSLPTGFGSATDPTALQVGGWVNNYHWLGAYIDVNAVPRVLHTSSAP